MSVANQLRQPWAIRVANELQQPWAIRVASQLRQPYGFPVVNQLRQPWGNTIANHVRQPYSGTLAAINQLRQPYTDTVPAQGQLRQHFDILPFHRVARQLRQVYNLGDLATINATTVVRVVHQGRDLAAGDLNLRMTDGGYAWTARIRILSPADYVAVAKDGPVSVLFGGESYSLLVDRKTVQRDQAGAPVMYLDCVSPSAVHADPRAVRIGKTWDQAVYASAASEEVIGETIDWQLVDWQIPAGRLSVTDAAPVDVVREIAAAAGGVLETKPDGSLLVRHRFPVAVPDWPTAHPDHTLTDAGDILGVSDEVAVRRPLDEIVITDDTETAATLSIEIDPRPDGLNHGRTSHLAGDRVGLLVYPHDAVLSGQYSSVGLLTSEAEQTLIETVDLSFANSTTAQLPRRAFQIDNVQWIGEQLGTLALSTDGRTVTVRPPVLAFDGATGYVGAPKIAAYDFTEQITMEAVVKIDSFPEVNAQIFARNAPYMLFVTNANRLQAGLYNGSAWTFFAAASQSIVLGQYHHMAATWDGQTVRFYVDGAQSGSDSAWVGPLGKTNNPVQIGRDAAVGGRFYLDGQVSEVRLWSVARSATQILANSNRPLRGDEPGLVGYWQLNDGAGGTARDLSVHANHATLNGGTSWINDPSVLVTAAPRTAIARVTYRAKASAVQLNTPATVGGSSDYPALVVLESDQ